MLLQICQELAQEVERGRRDRPEREEPEAERHPLSGKEEGRPDAGHSDRTSLRVLEDLLRCEVLLEHRAQVSGHQQVEPSEPREASHPFLRAVANEHALVDGPHDVEGERPGSLGRRRSFTFHRRREGHRHPGRGRDRSVPGGVLLQIRRAGTVPDRLWHTVLFGERRYLCLRPVLPAGGSAAHACQHRSSQTLGKTEQRHNMLKNHLARSDIYLALASRSRVAEAVMDWVEHHNSHNHHESWTVYRFGDAMKKKKTSM